MGTGRVSAIYSRKSKYTGKGESIENQIEMCREYIRMHDGEEEADLAVVFEDEGFSGGNLDRPQFRAMMEEAGAGRFRQIVVYRLDRISRNIGDFANLIDGLGRAGIDFVSIKEQFDTGSPMGRAMMYISSVFSQLERETIAERIRDNLRELAKTGRWLGGNTPTGYRSAHVVTINIDGRQKRACMLEEVPEEMEVVDVIFSQFYRTRSLTKLDAYLLENGYRTKLGNEFSRFATKAILSNPVYMVADEAAYGYLSGHGAQLYAEEAEFDGIHGVMAYNRTRQEKGRAHKPNPMDEWVVSVGKHKGRIPGRIWVEVQEALERNRSKNYKKPRSHEALLSGVLRCGCCGAYMRPKLGRKILDGGERAYMYLCVRKERSQRSRCAMRNARGNALDAELMERMKGLDEDGPEFLKRLAEGQKAIMREGRRGAACGDGLPMARRELEAAERRIVRLVNALSMAPEGSGRYILQQIEELNGRIRQLAMQAEEEEASRGMAAAGECPGNPAMGAKGAVEAMEPGRLAQMAGPFGGVADSLSVEQKRDAIRMLVKDVIWDGGQAHVILFGCGDGDRLSERSAGDASKEETLPEGPGERGPGGQKPSCEHRE